MEKQQFEWTSELVQDPSPWRRIVLKRDIIQNTWTCSHVGIPTVTVRRTPVEDAGASALAPPSQSDSNCVSSAPMQVTTTEEKTLAVAERRKSVGPGSAACRRKLAFLQQRRIARSAANRRPVLASCPGRSCSGDCSQGVGCRRERPPAPRHHLILKPEELLVNKRRCIVLDDLPSSKPRVVRRRR